MNMRVCVAACVLAVSALLSGCVVSSSGGGGGTVTDVQAAESVLERMGFDDVQFARKEGQLYMFFVTAGKCSGVEVAVDAGRNVSVNSSGGPLPVYNDETLGSYDGYRNCFE